MIKLENRSVLVVVPLVEQVHAYRCEGKYMLLLSFLICLCSVILHEYIHLQVITYITGIFNIHFPLSLSNLLLYNYGLHTIARIACNRSIITLHGCIYMCTYMYMYT